MVPEGLQGHRGWVGLAWLGEESQLMTSPSRGREKSMQDWFNTQNSISVIHYFFNRKNNKHSINDLIESEKEFDTVHHLIMIKTLSTLD